MKKALLVMAALAVTASTYAQSAVGNITFVNRNIPVTGGGGTGGGNGNGTYNVPIFADNGDLVNGNSALSAGTLSGGVTVGLFSGATLLGSTLLRSDTAANARFFATASQTFDVPGSTPGATASLIVRAWQGASFQAASTTPGLQHGEWAFTSAPLGGTPTGGLPVPTPSMTGWGPQDGSGYELTTTAVPEPSTIALGAIGIGALLLRRRK